MQVIKKELVKVVYVWGGSVYLSWDDADEAFSTAGEEGYNGLPWEEELVDFSKLPASGRIWADGTGFYPDRNSCQDFDGASLVSVLVS